MSDHTVVPVIRTRKRRLVAPEKRKKALFSCDRCKVRKIACHRSGQGLPCDGCTKSGIECATTIKRKKKIRGPIENIGLHYKCLLMLVKCLFPEVDVNNIDALIDVGERHGILMPSRYGGTNGEANELRDLSILITSGKMRSRSQSSDEDSEPFIKEEEDFASALELPAPADAVISAKTSNRDYIIIDSGGNSHCIGPMGAPGFLDSYMKIIGVKANVDYLKFATFQRISKGEIIISSNHEPMQARDLKSVFLNNFPYLSDIGRQEADVYVNVFFNKIHPRLLCFNETSFRKSYEKFWASIATDSPAADLSNNTICCMYMVWIISRLYDPLAVPDGLDEVIFKRYLHTVKFCLSDILLTPTLDGIQCLLLLSVYMDNRKRRETGYILLELAARQAISLGLNRKSLLLCTEDKARIEEMQRTWWTVFVLEVCFSNQMGRSSCIQIEDVNTDYPMCMDVTANVGYSKGYLAVVQLTRVLYEVLEYRKLFTNSNDLLFDHHVARAAQLSDKMTSCFENLDPSLHDFSEFSDWKAHVHFRYHYYRLLLTLPVFLKAADEPHMVISPILQKLSNQCLQLCVAVADFMEMSGKNALLNGTLFPDIFYAYHATMGLVVGYWLVKESGSLINLDYTLSDISDAVEKIKLLNLSTSGISGGTLLKISRYIDAFIAGLECLKTRPKQPFTSQQSEGDSDFPVVGRADMQAFVLAAKLKANTPQQPAEADFEDLFLFPGRQGFGEFSIGLLDFSETLADYGLAPGSMFDAMGDSLFKNDVF